MSIIIRNELETIVMRKEAERRLKAQEKLDREVFHDASLERLMKKIKARIKHNEAKEETV